VILTADAEDIAGLLGCDVGKAKDPDAARIGAAPETAALGHETSQLFMATTKPRTKQ
jgi:hypothetical protein